MRRDDIRARSGTVFAADELSSRRLYPGWFIQSAPLQQNLQGAT